MRAGREACSGLKGGPEIVIWRMANYTSPHSTRFPVRPSRLILDLSQDLAATLSVFSYKMLP